MFNCTHHFKNRDFWFMISSYFNFEMRRNNSKKQIYKAKNLFWVSKLEISFRL